jgi:uncharacterized membrane protein YraQ (UPF0718 family)
MTQVLYFLSIAGLIVSFMKSKQKTKMVLMKAWKSFSNILPQLLGIMMIVGFSLSFLSAQQISRLVGESSGYLGVLIASLVGSISLIPGFVAFPLAKALKENGAGYMQLAALISTLMMVGILTLPVEMTYFGKKASIVRNVLAFIFSIIVALVIGAVLK